MDQSPSPTLKWWIALIPALSRLSVGLSISAVTIAIPSMMASLSASLNQIHWVLTGFLITRTVIMPTVGWLESRLGNRNLFILSSAAFTVGSFFCSIAWNADSLVFFRLLQAMGAGPLVPITMVMIIQAFPPHQRGLALGMSSACWSAAIYIGPPLGGLLTELIHWRAIFYINVIVGLLGILGAYFLSPQENTNKRAIPFDLIGFLALTAGTSAFLLAMSQGRELGWRSPLIVGLLSVSLVLLPFFVFHELRTKSPFLELRYFRNWNFSMVNLLNFSRLSVFRGANFLTSLFFQRGLNYTPFQAGLFFLPGAVLTGIFSPLAGTVSDRLSPRIPIIVGFGTLILAAYGFSTVTLWTSMASIFLFISLFGVGQSCLNTPLNSVGFRALPDGKTAMGSGIIYMVRGLGESFGIAFFTVLLEREVFMNLSFMTPPQGAHLSEPARFEVLSRLHHLLLQAGDYASALPSHARSFLSYTLLSEAVTHTYQELFLWIAAFYLLMLVTSALFLRSGSREVQPVRPS